MTRINPDHTSISELITRTIQDPFDANGCLREEHQGLTIEELSLLSEESRLSAPVHGQPNLVRYVLNQVGLGRTTLQPEILEHVGVAEGTQLINYLKVEGGRHAEVASALHGKTGKAALMQIGRYVLMWDRTKEPAESSPSPLTVKELADTKAAKTELDLLIELDDAAKATARDSRENVYRLVRLGKNFEREISKLSHSKELLAEAAAVTRTIIRDGAQIPGRF